MKKFIYPLGLGFSAALLGALVGAVTGGFLQLLEIGEHWLWHELSNGWLVQPLIICTLGGVLVGVCQKYLGDHPAPLNEAVHTMLKTGRLEYHHLPHGLTTIMVSLLAGGSLGPESAIVDLSGGLGTWAGEQIAALRAWLALPLRTTSNRWLNWLYHWPNFIALLAGLLAFKQVVGDLYSSGLLNLGATFAWSDLGWAIPAALVGASGGWLYLFLQTKFKQWLMPLQTRPVIRGAVGGVVLGLVALALPSVLFSGQHELQPLYTETAQLGLAVLFFTGLARVLVTSLLLATGWKGGQFLPLLVGGAAFGLTLHSVFAFIPAPAATLGSMAALMAVVLPQPLLAFILMAVLFPFQYVGVSLVAVGLVVGGKRFWQSRASQPTSNSHSSLSVD